MAYVKQTFVDNVTPLDAEHFNHMEDGIFTLDSEKLARTELASAIDTALADAAASGEFKGDPGEDGYSPSAAVNQTDAGAEITVSDQNGVTTAVITNGADGKTPVKGTDYYTEADKAEMTAEVKAALTSETWTFTLSDGSTATKKVAIL